MKKVRAMSRRQILELDLETCLVHELGHVVYALSRGCQHVELWISLRSVKRESLAEIKLVAGRVLYSRGLTDTNKSAMGFAGILADCLWEDDMEPFDYYEQVRLEGCLSETDQKAIQTVSGGLQHRAFLRALKCIELYREHIEAEVAGIKALFFRNKMQPHVIHFTQEWFQRRKRQ